MGGVGERLRYLKRRIQILLLLTTVFCSFNVSLPACYFHSSALTKSLAQTNFKPNDENDVISVGDTSNAEKRRSSSPDRI